MLAVLLTTTSLFTISYAQNSTNADDQIEATEAIDADRFFSSAIVVQSDENMVVLKDTEVLASNFNSSNHSIDKVSTTIAFFAKDEAESRELRSLAETKSSGGSKYRYLWDKSGQAKLHTRVYYTETSKGTSTEVSLTKVIGGFDAGGSGAVVGSGVAVVLNQCRFKQYGKNVSGTMRKYDVTKTYPNSKRSWTYTDCSSWKPVENCPANQCGCTYTVKLKRNTTWITALSNSVI